MDFIMYFAVECLIIPPAGFITLIILEIYIEEALNSLANFLLLF